MEETNREELVLSIIIVSWNTKDLLRQCLSSVFTAARPMKYEIFVVDNASSDGSASMVRSEFPKVKLISNNSNRGFAAANNQALKLCAGKYVLFLNPDTLAPPASLAQLVAFANRHPDAGAVGAKLLNPDGTPGIDRGKFPTMRTLFNHAFFLNRLFPRVSLFQGVFAKHDATEPEQVDWVGGACMLVRREAIQQVGPLDERIFMFGEDMEFCWRLWKAGWSVYYNPHVRIIHYGGESLLQQETSFLRSKKLGWSPSSEDGRRVVRLCEKAIVLADGIFRLCTYPFLYLFTFNRKWKRRAKRIWKNIREFNLM